MERCLCHLNGRLLQVFCSARLGFAPIASSCQQRCLQTKSVAGARHRLLFRALPAGERVVHAAATIAEDLAGGCAPATTFAAEQELPEQLGGSIDLILGPMFAGKTSELLRRVSALEALGRRVAVIKSFKDDRYHATNITTHDGISRPCYALTNLREFKDSMADRYSDAEVIAIDEAQFFPDLHQFCTDAADRDGKLVILAGLDGDFKRKRFGQVLDLIPVADSVTKLKANCAYCSSRALFSLRIAADDRQEVVGGADKYAPVCRQHYVSLSQLRVEADTD